MGKSEFNALAIFCLLFLNIPFAYAQDTDWYKQRANELGRVGMRLNAEGRYIESLDTFKVVLRYRIKAYGEQDYMLGSAYLAVGIGYFNLGQYDLALENYQLAEKNYLLRGDPNITSLARLYRNIGNVYRTKLDYKNALLYSKQALAIFENQAPADLYDVIEANYAIAEIYYLMKDYNKSLSILNDFTEEADDYNKIYFSELTAIVHQALNNNEEAKRYYEKTIEQFKSYYGDSSYESVRPYLNYAEFLALNSEFNQGMINLEKAYRILKIYQPHKGKELSRYYEFKGLLYRNKPIETENIKSFRQQKKENLEEAIKWYNESLLALYADDNNLNIEKLKIDNTISFTDCLVILKAIGDTYNELASLDNEDKIPIYLTNIENALHYYRVTGQLIQQARKEISGDESKIQLAQLEYSTFTKTIETAYLAYKLTKDKQHLLLAFNNSEQIKSSAVFDKISNDIARENSLIPDSLLELETKLNQTLSIYNEKIFEENRADNPDSSLISEYSDIIFEANRKRDDLNQLLEEKYPDYYNLKYSNSMLTIDGVQNQLNKKEVILEYVLNETDSSSVLYSFLISKEKQLFLKQDISPTQTKSMEYIFRFMTSPNYIFTQNEDAVSFCVSAYDVYQLLIAPFEKEIENKNLTIIPDGKLNYIAFDGLLMSLPDTAKLIDFSKLDYLVRDYNVNYANSANILMSSRNTKRNIKNEVLAFAPAYNSEQFELSNASYTLMPLPGVQKEVDAIAETVKTNVYRGERATEDNFRKLSTKFDILHLAMHAYINDSLPAYSRLAFSPVQNKDSLKLDTDGWLNTADIYNLDLSNVRLTVLSACNTGVGKMQKGEGLMSLARGFLFAGCPSIIMSLWEVEDNAGTQIMTSFYKSLKNGKTKDEALRLAKIEYLDNANSRLAHPHYWMSFKCIGDQSPIYTSNDLYFFAVLILLIIAFAIDQGLRIKKARRKRQAL